MSLKGDDAAPDLPATYIPKTAKEREAVRIERALISHGLSAAMRAART